MMSHDWLLAVLAPVIVWLMAQDGVIDMIDGIVLALLFVIWPTVLVVVAGRRRRLDAPVADEVPHVTWKIVLSACLPDLAC